MLASTNSGRNDKDPPQDAAQALLQAQELKHTFSEADSLLVEEKLDAKRRANLHLAISLVCAMLSLSIAYFGLKDLAGSNTSGLLSYFLPRSPAIALIGVAYYFFSLYRASLDDIKAVRAERVRFFRTKVALQNGVQKAHLPSAISLVKAIVSDPKPPPATSSNGKGKSDLKNLLDMVKPFLKQFLGRA